YVPRVKLKKCLADLTLQVPLDEIRVDDKLKFMEEPVEILEIEFKKLKRSRIAIVKVWWNSKREPEFIWEHEDRMKLKRMIAELGDGKRDVNVHETFHEQTDDGLSEKELKQIEADDQA
nr:putative reverse transcriptase domain-containing protein [Tanacetum cinerariifolium]